MCLCKHTVPEAASSGKAALSGPAGRSGLQTRPGAARGGRSPCSCASGRGPFSAVSHLSGVCALVRDVRMEISDALRGRVSGT